MSPDNDELSLPVAACLDWQQTSQVRKLFSGFENVLENATVWIPLTATAGQRERDGCPRCLAEDAHVVSVFSLLFSLSFNVLRRAKVKRLFVLTGLNSQDCRKDAGRFCDFPGPAVVPGEILPQ